MSGACNIRSFAYLGLIESNAMSRRRSFSASGSPRRTARRKNVTRSQRLLVGSVELALPNVDEKGRAARPLASPSGNRAHFVCADAGGRLAVAVLHIGFDRVTV